MKFVFPFKKSAAFLVLFCFSHMMYAQGNLVINGDFSNNSDATNVSGWALSGQCFADTKSGNPTPSIQLLQTAGADQVVNGLVSGMNYFVSGDYSVHQASNFSFGVTMDGTKMFEITSSTDSNWHGFNFSYSATSSTVDLGIYLSEGQGLGLFNVDNVSMQVVPEPSSEMLLGLGGLIFLWHRRKTKAFFV